jgi:cell division protein FtsB
VASRRPRVPKSSQRELADVGAGARSRSGTFGAGYDAGPGTSSAHLVGGYSAKVIPLDSAPSRHGAPRRAEPRDAEVQSGGPDGTDPQPRKTQDAEVPVAEDPVVEGSDTAGATRAYGLAETAADAKPASERTAEQRRAAERQALLHRSARSSGRRIPRAPRPGAARADNPRAAAADPDTDHDAPRPAEPAGPGRGTGSAVRSGNLPSTPSARALALRPAADKPVVVEPVPARNFTGRSVAFLVVLFVAAVLLAPTLRVFLDQQSELRAVQEDIASERELQQQLTHEIARWDDPAYIQQQARERFNLVLPGEQTYMVIGGEDPAEDPVPPPASPSDVNPDMPWADALWDSVVRAGTD